MATTFYERESVPRLVHTILLFPFKDIDSGDTLDFVDSSSATTQTSRVDGYPYDDVSGFAADELDEDVSGDAR
jgi:hypothetical protein